MELPFDERKLLTPGVYDVSLDTVREHFGKFQRSDRRPMLYAKLVDYLDAVKKADCGANVIIDGSFVMACVDEPSDIDVILVLPPDWDMKADLKPYQYNLVSKRRVRKAYGFDTAIVTANSVEEAEWLRFFQLVRPKWREKFGWPEDIRKGIIRVHP